MLKGFSRGYVNNENFEQAFITNAKLLYQIDGTFSFLQKVNPTCEIIRESGVFVDASMKTWHKLGLSVTPKEHIFQDHAIEFIQNINGLGDKTKYFIEFSHQDGACHDRCTKRLRDYKQNHESQNKA